jgi:FkbM family methyltransferase
MSADALIARGARRLMHAVPENRRVKGLGGAKGRRLLQTRKLIAPLFQRPVTLTTNDGLRLRVTTDPVDEHIAQHLLGSRRGDYFPTWPDGPPEAPCILDIGAHHGLYAAAALHAYPSSSIICVEPSLHALPALQANLALNQFEDRARVANVGLAPASGSAELQHTRDGSWGYSLYESAADAIGHEPVTLATLPEILGDDKPQIVKCNAEGAEFSLIDQLIETDIRPSLLIVMVHPAFGNIDNLIAQAGTMGYRVSSIGSPERPAFHMWQTITS